ncbi:TPA: hypothetical protein ENS27_16405, partial [bacterium]|nr:hypothetical protein [bacterium]
EETENNLAKNEKPNWFRENAKWLIIIAVLVLIIIVGAIYVVLIPPGKDAVKILSFKPTGKVSQNTNFTIEFSQNIAGDDDLGKEFTDAVIKFTPSLTGIYRWTDRNVLQFYPNVLLLPSTKYVANILPEIATKAGYYIKGKKEFEFHTEKFKIEYALLSYRFNTPDDKVVPIVGTLEFNYPVELDDIQKNLTISYKGGNQIPYQIVSPQAGTVINIETEPIPNPDRGHSIQLVINEDLVPANGTDGFDKAYSEYFNLKSGGDLKIDGVFPEQQMEYGYIKIRFASPVKAELAKQYISIEPVTDYDLTSNFHYVELRGKFASGSYYNISIKKGLMAVDGAILKNDFQTSVVMQNVEPSLSFIGDGIYLARKGKLNVGLSTVNIKKARIEIRKIYINNLSHLVNAGAMDSPYYWYNVESMGKTIYSEEVDISDRMNEEVITPINMESYLADQRAGVFDVQATSMDDYWRDARKIVMITDLGITAKRANDRFIVWANSLSTLKPIKDANVTILSQNNQVMATGKTNSNGIADITIPKSVLDEFSPYIITVSSGEDVSFLELGRNQISTTDFDVEGSPYLQDGFDAYVYGDRDIYRPGEKAHVAIIIRGKKASVPPSMPIKLEVLSPDNRIFAEFRKVINDKASCEFEIDVPDYAMTGLYTARVIIGKDKEIGRGGFSVEEFMPDRMKVNINTDSDSYDLGQAITINVSAVSLFGPAAIGRNVDLVSEIRTKQFSPKEWSSFSFGDPNKSFNNIINNLGRGVLDSEGKYSLIQSLPIGISPPSSLQNTISATVHETGGRTVTAQKTVDVYPYQYFVGLRQAKDGYAQINKPTEFEFVVLGKNSQPMAGRQCEISCYRVTWQTIMQKVNGKIQYDSQRQENLVKSLSLASGTTATKFSFTPDQYSEYRVEIRESDGHSSSISFYVSGWGSSPWAMSKPERLDIGLDKKIYKHGETAKVQIRSPFAGRLLLTVEGDEVYEIDSKDMKENTGTVNIKISDKYKPNAYISASVIRSTNSLEQNAPVRAYGVVPLMVDSSKNKLDIKLDAVETMRPNSPLKVSYTVNGRNKNGYITIAAVDEGICQLTDFKTPSPFDHFFGKKRLEVTTHDIYAWILPEIDGTKTTSSTAGGEPGAVKRRVSPISVARVKPVAMWSGLTKVDKNGKGSVTFNIPQFNGRLRVMAVSFSDDEFGSISKDVTVRDPIVLIPTFPRFIASGDRFVVPVTVYNGTDKSDTFTINLTATGPVDTPSPSMQKVVLSPKEEKQIMFTIKAKDLMGKVTFKVSAIGAGEQVSEETDVPLRPASPPITLTGSGTVKANTSGTFTIPGSWITGTSDFEVTVSSLPVMQFASSLQYLLQYPYGCAEQTASRVFPLLYFNDIAKAIEPKLFGTNSPDYFINEGITKLVNMQFPSGDFAFWPSASYGNPWTSIYVSHFLAEARKAGYEVPERAYQNMIKALKRHAKITITENWHEGVKTYACYVLSIIGEPDRSTMLYLKNTELKRMSDDSQALLAGAFALSGDTNTANALIPKTSQSREIKRQTGYNFDSSIRSDAIILSVLAEMNPDHPLVPKLVQKLSNSASKNNRWYTTQENAFAFLALGKLFRNQPPGKYTGTININGSNIGKFTNNDQLFTGKDWGGRQITLDIKGTGTCYYYWKAFGVPIESEVREFDEELTVRRKYLSSEGKLVSYTNFQQGDLVVAEITCKALTESLDNVVIVDLLPAGFEIENPRLGSRAGISWIKDTGIYPSYMDIRDDRMILFVNLPKMQEVKFYYALRVVSVGDFVLPSISAEAMYDPAKASVSSGGRIRVAQ